MLSIPSLKYWLTTRGSSIIDGSAVQDMGLATNVVQTPGVFGTGMNFAGHYAWSSYQSKLNAADRTPFSLAVWIKTGQATPGSIIRHGGAQSGGWADAFGMVVSWTSLVGGTAGRLVVGMKSSVGGWQAGFSNATVNDNVWHHCCFTTDGTTGKIYIDGKLDNTIVGQFYGMGTNPSWIFGKYMYNAEYYYGAMDDAMIFTSCLSLPDIKRLMLGFNPLAK